MSIGNIVGSASFQLLTGKRGFTLGLQDAQGEAQSAVANIGNTLQGLGRIASQAGLAFTAGFTAPIVGLTKSVFEIGSSFESAFAGVAKTFPGTNAQLTEFRDTIRDMANDMPTTREEISAVAEAAGQLGISATGIESFTETMIKLGETTNLSATSAATELARLANIMGTSEDQFDELGNVVVDLGNNFATTESEIINMSSRIAGAGKIVGLSTTEVLSLATAMSSLGIRVEAGGSSISRTLITIANAVAEGSGDIELFAQVAGQSVDQFSKLFKEDASTALVAFVDGLRKVNESGGNVFETLDNLSLGEQRVRETLLKLINGGDLLTEAFDRGSTALENNNALTIEYGKRVETIDSQLAILKNRVTDVAVSLFDAFRPQIVSGIQKFGEIISTVTEKVTGFIDGLDDGTKKIIITVAALLAGIGPALLVIGAIGLALSTILNPVTLVILAIGALAAAFITVDQNSSFFEEKWPGIVESVNGVKEAFSDLKEAFLDLIFVFDSNENVAGFQNLKGSTVDFQLVLEKTAQTLAAFFQLFLTGIELTVNGISLVIDAYKLLFELLDPRNLKFDFNPLSDNFGLSVSGDIEKAFGDVLASGKELGTDFAEGLANGFDTYWNGLGAPKVRDTVEQTFRGFTLDEFREAFSETANGAIESFALMKAHVLSDLLSLRDDGITAIVPALRNMQNEADFTALLWAYFAQGIIDGSDIAIASVGEVESAFLQMNTSALDFENTIDSISETSLTSRDVMAGWGQAMDILRGNIESSSGATALWESDLGNINKAIEYYTEQIEAGNDPTGEFADNLQFLSEKAAPRVQAGIDGLGGAFAENVVIFEKFRLAQDALNKQLEEGTLTPEKYAAAQKSMTDQLIASQDPQLQMIGLQRDLASAFGDVITRIEDLLIAMGIIPPRVESEIDINAGDRADQVEALRGKMGEVDGTDVHASVDIAGAGDGIDQLEVMDEKLLIFDDTRAEAILEADANRADAEVEAATLLAQNYGDLEPEASLFVDAEQFNTAVNNAYTELDILENTVVESTANLDRADAILGFGEITTKANEIDGRILNMQVAFDGAQAIQDAIETANIIAGYTVAKSPTELGPLSQIPDWSFLFDSLPDEAKKYTDETIQHLQNFVNLASSVLDLFSKSLSFAGEARGFSGRLPTLSFVQELAAFATSVTAEVGFLAQQFEEGFLDATNRFNTAAQSSLGTLIQAVDLITKITELGSFRTGQLQLDQISDLKFLVEHIVNSIGDTAEFIISGRGLPFVQIADQFAQAAQSSLALIVPAVEALQAIAKLGGRSITAQDFDSASQIKFFVEHLVGSIGDSAAYLLGQRGLTSGGTFFADATEIANAGKSAFDLISGINDVLDAISEGRGITQDDFDIVSSIKFFVEHVVSSFGDSAAHLELLRGEGFLEGAQRFADTVNASIGALSVTLEFLSTLGDLTGKISVSSDQIHSYVSALASTALDIARIFNDVAGQFEESVEGSIDRLATAVSNSVGALSDTLGFLVDMSENVVKINLSSDAIYSYVSALASTALDLAQIFDNVAKDFEESVEGSIDRLATAVGNSTSALSSTLGFLVDLSANIEKVTLSSDLIKAYAEILAQRAVDIAEEFNRVAAEWDGKVAPESEKLVSAISDSLSAIGSVLGFLGSLTDALNRENRIDFGASIRAIAAQLAQRGREAAEAFIDVVKTWEVDEDVKTKVEDAAKVIQDAFGALNAVISFMNQVTDDGFKIRGGQLITTARRIAELGVQVGNLFAEAGGGLSEDSRAGLNAYAEWFRNIEGIFSFLADIQSQAPDAVQNAYTFQDAAREIALAVKTGTDALLSIGNLADLSFSGSFSSPSSNINTDPNSTFSGQNNAIPAKSITVNLDIDGETFHTFIVDTVNETIEELY